MAAKQSLQKNEKSSPLFDEWRQSKRKKLSIFFFFFFKFSFSHFSIFLNSHILLLCNFMLKKYASLVGW